MIAFACVLVTIGALFYVFGMPYEIHSGQEKTRLSYLRERKEVVYENLRDLNFEYKAGKLPDTDYQAMKTSLEEEAADYNDPADWTEIIAITFGTPGLRDQDGIWLGRLLFVVGAQVPPADASTNPSSLRLMTRLLFCSWHNSTPPRPA